MRHSNLNSTVFQGASHNSPGYLRCVYNVICFQCQSRSLNSCVGLEGKYNNQLNVGKQLNIFILTRCVGFISQSPVMYPSRGSKRMLGGIPLGHLCRLCCQHLQNYCAWSQSLFLIQPLLKIPFLYKMLLLYVSIFSYFQLHFLAQAFFWGGFVAVEFCCWEEVERRHACMRAHTHNFLLNSVVIEALLYLPGPAASSYFIQSIVC